MGEKKYLMQGLKKFLQSLSKDINVEKIILFGSRAKKDFDKQSDVDLIIVSEDFEEMNFFERALVKKISGSNKNVSKIDIEVIHNFVRLFEKNRNNMN